jgi:hypothetical protein
MHTRTFRRRTSRGFPLALVAAAAMVSATAVTAHASSSVEVEGMTLPTSVGYLQADSAASGGKAFKFLGNGVASKQLTTSATTGRIVLRARGIQCSGAPVASVTVDGKEVLRSSVASTTYADFGVTVSLPKGIHTVKAAFVNDYATSSCDRNLYADKLTLLDQTTSPAPSPTPAPTPAPPVVQPTALFVGDFETANLGQWSSAQQCAPNTQISVTTSPRRQGNYAGKMAVNGAGTCFNDQSWRAELESMNKYQVTEGADRYYGWSTYFDSNFPNITTSDHCNFMQWKDASGGPPLAMSCRLNKIHFDYTPGATCGFSSPIVRGGWNDFVLHIKHSTSASTGYIEFWHKAPNEAAITKKVNRCAATTLGPAPNYLKQGLYRGNQTGGSATVYQDGLRAGTSYDSVAPR